MTFLKTFYRYSSFITTPGQHTPGSLADISPESKGFLAFIRLVGVTYFTKHLPAFQTETPVSYFPDTNADQHHEEWYTGIRERIWERISFEDELPPGLDAMKLHWLRSLWVIDYWRQAPLNSVTLLPLQWFGWETENGRVQVEWDSLESLQLSYSVDVAAKRVAVQLDVNASNLDDCVAQDAFVAGAQSAKTRDK